MNIKPLDEHLSVSPQIDLSDIPALAAAGFRSIISNRPDGEERGQPTAADVEEAARSAGLGFAHVPAIPGHLTAENASDMARALAELPGPVLAFCKSGGRAQQLAEMAEAHAPLGVQGRARDER